MIIILKSTFNHIFSKKFFCQNFTFSHIWIFAPKSDFFFFYFRAKRSEKKSVFFSLYKWKKSVKLGFQNWKKLGQKMEVWNSVQSWLLKFLTLISKDIQVSHSWHRTFKRTPNWFSRYRKFHTHFLTIYHFLKIKLNLPTFFSGGLFANMGHTVRLPLFEILRWNYQIRERMRSSGLGTR